MADKTKIEWTDATWNPIVGCSVVSPGCTNCYAMKQAARIEAMYVGTHVKGGQGAPFSPSHYAGTTQDTKAGPVWTGKVAMASDETLAAPLRWKRPRRIFVNSMGDLFHESIPDEWIDRVFAVTALATQHVHQVLTKRSARMRAYANDPQTPVRIVKAMLREGRNLRDGHPGFFSQRFIRRENGDIAVRWPLPNVHMGVSTEDQPRADERIPDLLATPAAVRFVSAEPLLGPIDLSPFIRATRRHEREWSDFQWPAWVPGKIRHEVMDFWRKEWGRGPSAWLRSSIENGHPALGTIGEFSLLRAGEPKVEGRFVHAWNNIGRVVASDGNAHCVSSGRWQTPNPYVDQIITGGESGQHARYTPRALFRSVRDQCVPAGVAYFHKQNGEFIDADEWLDLLNSTCGTDLFEADLQTPWSPPRPLSFANAQMLAQATGGRCEHQSDGSTLIRVGKRRAGRLLDGVAHNATPEASHAA